MREQASFRQLLSWLRQQGLAEQQTVVLWRMLVWEQQQMLAWPLLVFSLQELHLWLVLEQQACLLVLQVLQLCEWLGQAYLEPA